MHYKNVLRLYLEGRWQEWTIYADCRGLCINKTGLIVLFASDQNENAFLRG